MTALAFNFKMQHLGVTPSGGLYFEINCALCDPALQGDGSGHDARFIAPTIVLDPTTPQTWAADIEAAIIAEGAAQPQPFTLTPGRVFTPVFSEQPTVTNYSYHTPTTGFNLTANPLVGVMVLNPAGLLATGTINMPASPQDGRLVKISTTQVITLLTLSGNGNTVVGAISTLAALGSVEYLFNAAQASWFRVG